jgi:soluble cytochrome b562
MNSLLQRALLLIVTLSVITPVLPPLHAAGGEKHTALEDSMEKMNGAFRKLRRQVTDPTKNANSLELVANLRAASQKSIDLVPKLAAERPEAERPAFTAAYKKQMEEFVAALAPLEAALKAGNNAEAEKLVADLGARQKKGHKDFKKQEKKS